MAIRQESYVSAYGLVKRRVPVRRGATRPQLERRGGSRGKSVHNDDVAIHAEGPDRIVIRGAPSDPTEALGVFDGLYEDDYLEQLRTGERA